MTRDPGNGSDEAAAAEWELAARYLAGEAGPDEAARARAWLAAQAGLAESVGALDRALSRLAHPQPDVDVEAALRKVRDRLAEPDVRPIEAARERAWAGRRTVLLRAAAAVVIAVAAGALWWSVRTDPSAGPGLVAAEYRTGTGDVDTLRLPDGTQVVLGPSSRLEVAGGYGGVARDLTLEGLAAFDVVHDDARPFTVRANGAAIRDLGTRFAIRTGESEVTVVVTEGLVSLRNPELVADTGVVLAAGDRGVLDLSGTPRAERGAALDADLAWTDRRLVFENTSLAEVAAELRRWHGLAFRFEGVDMADRRLTATFEDETVEQILNVVALAIGARIERQGDSVFVRPAALPR